MAVFLMCACNPEDREASAHSITARVLYQSTLCNSTMRSPAVKVIKDQAELERIWKSLSSTIPASPKAAPRADFSGEMVLLLSMGQQPSGGYSLSLATNQVEVKKGELQVRLLWQEPKPGSIQVQMITRPCLMIAMPGVQGKNIRFVDQDRTLRFSLSADGG